MRSVKYPDFANTESIKHGATQMRSKYHIWLLKYMSSHALTQSYLAVERGGMSKGKIALRKNHPSKRHSAQYVGAKR